VKGEGIDQLFGNELRIDELIGGADASAGTAAPNSPRARLSEVVPECRRLLSSAAAASGCDWSHP
jgi:hypothetical protein